METTETRLESNVTVRYIDDAEKDSLVYFQFEDESCMAMPVAREKRAGLIVGMNGSLEYRGGKFLDFIA